VEGKSKDFRVIFLEENPEKSFRNRSEKIDESKKYCQSTIVKRLIFTNAKTEADVLKKTLSIEVDEIEQ